MTQQEIDDRKRHWQEQRRRISEIMSKMACLSVVNLDHYRNAKSVRDELSKRLGNV